MPLCPNAGATKLEYLVTVMPTEFLYPKKVIFPFHSNMGVSILSLPPNLLLIIKHFLFVLQETRVKLDKTWRPPPTDYKSAQV